MLFHSRWVNRKDPDGKNIFEGGFLGLDNIGLFDRSKPLPVGGRLDQADGTAWMSFYCVIMLEMSLILARRDPIYEDMASKFFEHFVFIIDAINNQSGKKDFFFCISISAFFSDLSLTLRRSQFNLWG